MIDDGPRLGEMVTLLGYMYLAMLNTLDRTNQLWSDSEFKDLGLITALYMDIPGYFSDSYDSDELDWKTHVQDYIKAYKIDTSFVFGSPEITLPKGDYSLDDREGFPKAGVDRWGFKEAVRQSRMCMRRRVANEVF